MGFVSQISTEELKSVALRYWKQALQMTKPKKVLAEMLLEMIDTLSKSVLERLSGPEFTLVSEEEVAIAIESCLTDVFHFVLGTTHHACAPLFKALSTEVWASVNSGLSQNGTQSITSYLPPKEHLITMINHIKLLLRFARDQEHQRRRSEPVPKVEEQTNDVRHHSADFTTRDPQVFEESECMDSQGQENKPEQLLRPEDAKSKDREAASPVEFLWSDQDWCYLLQEVCSQVLPNSKETDREQFFQLLLKNVEQQKSGYSVKLKPDQHHIKEVADAIYQDVSEKLGDWMHFMVFMYSEYSATIITDCILKWVSVQQLSSIQERASPESFNESCVEINTPQKPETCCTGSRFVLTNKMVQMLWLDYKALCDVNAIQELENQKQRNLAAPVDLRPIQRPDEVRDERTAADQFVWSDDDWSNLVFELSTRVFGIRNPQELARCSKLLFGHVQTLKNQCDVRVKPDKNNIVDVAKHIYKDLSQFHSKKALRMFASSDPDLIIAAIAKHLEMIPKKRTLGIVLRSVCRAIFMWC
uniref:Uncharacterized protein n=1 Tax=Knipowitschia caucasica TaxID=637954 RepID=A0AAV2KKH6_KNICA